jgi:hypothetical protein
VIHTLSPKRERVYHCCVCHCCSVQQPATKLVPWGVCGVWTCVSSGGSLAAEMLLQGAHPPQVPSGPSGVCAQALSVSVVVGEAFGTWHLVLCLLAQVCLLRRASAGCVPLCISTVSPWRALRCWLIS